MGWGLGRVRAVSGVLLDILAEVFANRSRRRLGRVGRTHQVAPSGDRAFASEHRDKHRSRRHVLAERTVKRPRPMDFVERPGLREREVHELKRADLESARLDSFYDVARETA